MFSPDDFGDLSLALFIGSSLLLFFLLAFTSGRNGSNKPPR